MYQRLLFAEADAEADADADAEAEADAVTMHKLFLSC